MGPVLVAELYRPRGEPMDASTAVAVHALWAKIGSWVSAEQMLTTHDATHGIRGMLDPDSVGEAQMLAAQELACHTHTSYATAMSHVTLVERVAQALPASWEALDRGEITVSHLKAVERETRNCPPARRRSRRHPGHPARRGARLDRE